MVMTVIVEDAVKSLSEEDQQLFYNDGSSILLYADDTLLMGSSEDSLQRLLTAVAEIGGRFGMELHSLGKVPTSGNP